MKTDYIKELYEQGYTVIENVISEEECQKIGKELEILEAKARGKDNYGYIETERQRTLFNVHYSKPDSFLYLIDHPRVMRLVKEILKDDFILSNFNASAAVENTKNKTEYRIHIDSRKPNPNPENTYQVVINWCIDDFKDENGSTVVIPGSHLRNEKPKDIRNCSEMVAINAPKGSILIILGQTWHDIGNNITNERRYGIIAYYSCWWIKPTFDFVESCTDKIFRLLNNDQKKLLNFCSRPPINWNMRNKTKCNIEDVPQNLEEAKNWDGY